uniref:RRM domain-containing protein n=1 Tax=Setaria digitata TaxID=48799 RepID=A0A915PYQ6_9BILA
MAYRERENAVTSTTKTAPSATDRSARSVFVGNISYEVGEEQLKQVFAQVGPVVHLRLVHDRDTGKPKGYGFCEYNDAQTAESAIRNLNGFELNGRPLRVDSAAGGDRSADEVQQLQAAFAAQQQEYLQQQAQESPYGPETEPEKAPEVISRSVASLPPEQMFELMKQMKQCVHNNPNEAKNLLMNNPQLAYALLQAQVVMRIVDPQVAIAMLHRETPAISQPFHQQQQQQTYSDASVPVSMSTMTNIPQPMFPGGIAQMTPPVVSSVPVNFPRAPSGPPVSRAPSPQRTDSELSPDDQQQAQLLMQACFSLI